MKKIISLLVVTAMVFSLAVSFNAASVSAFSSELHSWKYFDDETDNLYTSSDFSGKYFGYTGSTTAKNVSYGYVEGVSADEGESLLNVNSDIYTLQYNDAISFTKPVMNLSFKAYFPTVEATRRVYLSLSKKTATDKTVAIGNPEYWNTNYGNVYFTLNDESSKTWCGATENSVLVAQPKAYAVETGKWYNYSIRVYTHKYGEIYFAMFMNEELVGVVKSANADIKTDDIGIKQISMQMGSQDTYIKDIKLEMEDYDGAYAPMPAMEYFNTINFDDVEVTAKGRLNASSMGEHETLLQGSISSSNTSSHFYSSGTFSNVTNTVADYADAENALKVELTPNSSSKTSYGMFQNSGVNVTSSFPSGKTVTFQYSYDVNIAKGSEANQRRAFFQLSRNSSNASELTYAFVSNIQDGKIWFNVSSNKANVVQTADADILGHNEYAMETDKWYKITYLANITNASESAYEIVAEGFVTDLTTNKTEKIYQATTTLYKQTSGTDYLAYSGQRYLLYANAGTEKVTTYFDNMTNRICEGRLTTNFLDLTVDSFNDIDYRIVNNNVVTVTGNYTAETDKLIVAGYDKNNKVVKLSVGNEAADTTKGTVTHTWDFKEYPSICKVKAFMLNNLTDCVPLADTFTLYVD